MAKPIAWLPDDFDDIASLDFRRPFHTFLIKVASLCNLNCSYCYVYQTPDRSWEWKPKYLEKDTAMQIAARIGEHAAEYGLKEVTIVFHGGEPLLAGAERLRELVNIFTSAVPCKILWGMQTNGTLLDEHIIELFFEHRFRFGLSLDGNQEYNDRHRLYHSGKSSYDDTTKAIDLVRSFPGWEQIFGGVLVVIDVRNEPAKILATIAGFGVRSANILLPDSHHEATPPGRTPDNPLIYGQWLSAFFAEWYENYQHLEIPYFEEIISLMLGGVSGAEEIGAKSVDIIVLDTNGDIEAVDTLKVVGRDATSLNMNVATHSFDDALNHPAIFSRMSGFNTLCKQCRDCEYLDNCGGGYIPHRYSKENGFINPSIYCDDLKYLFAHIRRTIFKD